MSRVNAAQRPPASKFRRLAITHALMMGGDAAMVVALADSLFFDIDLDAARSRVLLFLVIGFAPFLVVAPLIGPLIDRVAGGRKFVIQVVALSRVVLTLLMAQYLDALALFPLVFASLVLQKTYAVSKSAIVPSTVRSEDELVEANSKLGLIAGITGAVAVVPAGILLQVVGAPATLVYGALLFVGALVAATRLSSDVVASDDADAVEARQLHSSNIQLGAIAMTVLRGLVGFTFFHLAFWLRSQDQGTFWFAAVVGVSALASMAGNAMASLLRERVREETMLSAALLVCAGAGLAVAALGGPIGAVVLAAVLNLMAALGRLNFESIVQRDAPGANRGRAFAVFETRFQFSWAMGAFIAVALQASGSIGFLVVGVVAVAASIHLLGGRRAHQPTGSTVTRRRPGRARGQVPRSRSGSGRPKDR
ncbi:MAG TPA: MFS transporter [Ilumatobacteraceae bacterium]|nr:MFS transporter [Ilumatobacteraceae bacterium]